MFSCVSEVLEIIVDLKNSAAGHDEISASLVKEISSFIVIPLTYICAKSMEQGIVPAGMKVAKIIPLFKSGDPSCFTTPISPYINFAFLEKLVYKRISSYLENQKILYEHQYGFRKKHSSYMALLQLVDQIYTARDNNEFASGTFLDLSKAFDTVNFNIL